MIIKGDVDGSIEALTDAILKLSTQEVQVNVIHKSVGQISESDVLLASASNAIIIGFQVRPSTSARANSPRTKEIEIRLYSIIYDAINELKRRPWKVCWRRSTRRKSSATSRSARSSRSRKSVRWPVVWCSTARSPQHQGAGGPRRYSTAANSARSVSAFQRRCGDVSAGYECGLSVQNFNDIRGATSSKDTNKGRSSVHWPDPFEPTVENAPVTGAFLWWCVNNSD